MTRQDFKLIAEAVKETKLVVQAHKGMVPYDADSALALLTVILARELATTNPLFSREKFLDACEKVSA